MNIVIANLDKREFLNVNETAIKNKYISIFSNKTFDSLLMNFIYRLQTSWKGNRIIMVSDNKCNCCPNGIRSALKEEFGEDLYFHIRQNFIHLPLICNLNVFHIPNFICNTALKEFIDLDYFLRHNNRHNYIYPLLSLIFIETEHNKLAIGSWACVSDCIYYSNKQPSGYYDLSLSASLVNFNLS